MTIKRLIALILTAGLLTAVSLGCSLLPSEADHSPGSQEMQITIE